MSKAQLKVNKHHLLTYIVALFNLLNKLLVTLIWVQHLLLAHVKQDSTVAVSVCGSGRRHYQILNY